MVKKNCKLKSHSIYIPMNIKLGKKKKPCYPNWCVGWEAGGYSVCQMGKKNVGKNSYVFLRI